MADGCYMALACVMIGLVLAVILIAISVEKVAIKYFVLGLMVLLAVLAYVAYGQDLVIDREEYGEINRVEFRVKDMTVTVFSDSGVVHIILSSEAKYLVQKLSEHVYYPSADSLNKAVVGICPVDSVAAIWSLDKKEFGGSTYVEWIKF